LCINPTSAFSSSISINRSYQYAHGGLIQFASRGPILASYHQHVKSGTATADNHISANLAPTKELEAVNVCSSLLSIQLCPWNPFIQSVIAVASAGSMPMVGNFIISRIDWMRTQQPQSCMHSQLRAQLNSSLWTYPYPYHVKKHTGSGTAATSSSMGPLCTQVCIYPTKDR